MYKVYVHTNKSNNKKYVGITSQSPNSRWRGGLGYNLGYRKKTYFYNSIVKYGWDNFEHDILFDNLSEEEAREKEVELIALWKTNDRNFGYNLTEGGEGTSGFTFYSREERLRRSEFMKNRIVSEETRKKMSESKKGHLSWNKGKKMSKEYREKVIETHWASKKVYCDGKIYRSITECAKDIRVPRKKLSDWLNGLRDIPEDYLHKDIKYYNKMEEVS